MQARLAWSNKHVAMSPHIILKEREERRQRREKLLLLSAARQRCLAKSEAEVVVAESQRGPPTEDYEESDLETPHPRTSPEVAAETQDMRLHSTRFRDYCDHVPSAEINNITRTLLTDLVFFQERLYQKDPIKARYKRRLVYGLKEVRKYLLLNKLKCIIFAPDIEEVKAAGN
ncbi:hypothetical protein HPB50_013457 [Hyalomma asiaticum]|uniref:Uncharacterized protein n=1 Tax=Hyalomma asiaticum TaxID=266040 RepID=A0ACB7S8L4_HYAAI|nr:hypothetical protein HPB50_013457 [Hyalomma asiaticum]